MKLACPCGATIVDQTDGLPHKAHLLADEDWFDLLDTIDRHVERAGPRPGAAERAAMAIRTALTRTARPVWQCRACGRLHVDVGGGATQAFEPADASGARGVLRRRPAPPM